MIDWNSYHDQVLAGVGELASLNPDVIRGYQAIGGAARKSNLLGSKVNELIALAAAVSLRCDGCIVVHTDAALKAGATREEIAEALGTAIGVNAGAGLVLFHPSNGCCQIEVVTVLYLTAGRPRRGRSQIMRQFPERQRLASRRSLQQPRLQRCVLQRVKRSNRLI